MCKVKTTSERLLAAQSRQKVYADNRRCDFMFVVRDMVFLKLSPMRGTMRFENRGNLSPKYIGPYEIIERVGNVAYWLSLLVGLEGVHLVFHVSMFRKYLSEHVIQP